jgi:hypothetical protein
MQNYKKFMAQVEERINKMGKKPQKTDGGIMSRKVKDDAMNDSDYVNIVATYIAAIRKTAQKVKAKNAA